MILRPPGQGQNQSIFTGIVVITPSAGNGLKTQGMIEGLGRLVGGAYFQPDSVHPQTAGASQGLLEQTAGDPLATVGRVNRQVSEYALIPRMLFVARSMISRL